MKKFNLRVYGIVLNERGEILLSDEVYAGRSMTKFPGGGLEWGEGFIDGLKREFLEELNWEIEVGDLFYLTDFFQLSAFHSDDQLISVYYLVQSKNYQFPENNGEQNRENHRWLSLQNLNPKTDLTFPIDQIVGEKIISKFLL